MADSSIVRSAVIIATALLGTNSSLRAQGLCEPAREIRETELVGAGSDYARLTELADTGRTTSRLARRLSNSGIEACRVGPWASNVPYEVDLQEPIAVVPISWGGILNSAYPEDRNNGTLWAGRGLSEELSGGVIVRLGRVTVGAIPTITHEQNRAYELLPPLTGRSQYANGLYRSVDAPQRFGPRAYSGFDAGQSFVRVDAWRLGIGYSKENVWWGPGISNAILFTNTAPGFPHVFLNTRKPLNIGIGRLTGEALWGKLSESRYFDSIPENDHRMIVGGLLTLEPGWVRGFYLGLGRTFVMPWDSISGRNLFPFGQTFWKKSLASPANPTGTSNDDQRVSIMARYVLPESHFEVYGEWAREDHAWNQSDFIQEPEHSAGHVIGAQKLFIRSDTRWIRWYGESANLQSLRQTRPAIRSTPSFYTHSPQGHTQLGQLLGASIGPGGESQLLGIDVLGPTSLWGGYVERVRRDEFSPRGIAAWSTTWPPRHDVAMTIGLKASKAAARLRLDGEIAHSKRYNRNFIRDESNTRMQLRISWVPR
jgi:hypothetical protein